MDTESRFRALFQRAYPALGRYASYRGLSKADADDLVSATLEIAWRRLDQIPDDDPLPWLYAVAYNLLRNHRRSVRRASVLLSRLPIPLPAPAPDDLGLPAGVLRAALGRLSEEDQEILRLIAWDGLSPSGAAVVLGCTAIAARSRLHRARRRLASALASEAGVQRSGSLGQVTDEGTDPMTNMEVPRDRLSP